MTERRITVIVDTRRFIVAFDAAGSPLRISERKTMNRGHPYLERVANRPYWHAKHHPSGGLPERIIAAAIPLLPVTPRA